MSFRTRLGLAALLLAVFSACGEGAGPLASSDETARRNASQAKASVEDLRAELEAEMETLADQIEAAEADDERAATQMGERLDYLAKRLNGALDRMAKRLEAIDGASASAESALAEARTVARDLAVLDKRLDYHLRNH
jgi:hypothetical protein